MVRLNGSCGRIKSFSFGGCCRCRHRREKGKRMMSAFIITQLPTLDLLYFFSSFHARVINAFIALYVSSRDEAAQKLKPVGVWRRKRNKCDKLRELFFSSFFSFFCLIFISMSVKKVERSKSHQQEREKFPFIIALKIPFHSDIAFSAWSYFNWSIPPRFGSFSCSRQHHS